MLKYEKGRTLPQRQQRGSMEELINDILMFWFGPLSEEGLSEPEQHALWFKSSKDTDRVCEERFGSLVGRAISGNLDGWASSDTGLIALLLLLDQFPRNIFRGTAAAFSGDSRSLVFARRAIADNRHLNIPLIHRVFLFLPLEHSENLDLQHQCVSLFEEMAKATELAQMTDFSRYAIAHRDVIAKFGRFPHRNAMLGRTSTPDEKKHLETHRGF